MTDYKHEISKEVARLESRVAVLEEQLATYKHRNAQLSAAWHANEARYAALQARCKQLEADAENSAAYHGTVSGAAV